MSFSSTQKNFKVLFVQVPDIFVCIMIIIIILPFITDCLGGYSADLIDNLKLLNLTRSDIDSILPGIQRIVVTEANALINSFKVTTLA